jgi:hypothetical protein
MEVLGVANLLLARSFLPADCPASRTRRTPLEFRQGKPGNEDSAVLGAQMIGVADHHQVNVQGSDRSGGARSRSAGSSVCAGSTGLRRQREQLGLRHSPYIRGHL